MADAIDYSTMVQQETHQIAYSLVMLSLSPFTSSACHSLVNPHTNHANQKAGDTVVTKLILNPAATSDFEFKTHNFISVGSGFLLLEGPSRSGLHHERKTGIDAPTPVNHKLLI